MIQLTKSSNGLDPLRPEIRSKRAWPKVSSRTDSESWELGGLSIWIHRSIDWQVADEVGFHFGKSHFWPNL